MIEQCGEEGFDQYHQHYRRDQSCCECATERKLFPWHPHPLRLILPSPRLPPYRLPPYGYLQVWEGEIGERYRHIVIVDHMLRFYLLLCIGTEFWIERTEFRELIRTIGD